MRITQIKSKKNKGFGLVEIVIGITIISLAFMGLMSVANISLRLLTENIKNLKAGFLLEEGMESIKFIRDDSWASNISPLTIDTDYYFEFKDSSWVPTTTNALVDGVFERRFVLEEVLRDANDDIIDVGGVADTNTRKVTIYVSWVTSTDTITRTMSSYIMNIFE